jgi:GDP-L-fucose synthase
MPSNVYGRGDHFDLERAHVVSAIVRRLCDAVDTDAASVTLWGTGAARREFLYIDDLADACLFLADRVSEPFLINVGTGQDVTIRGLAEMAASVVGFSGEIRWDTTQPDGMPRKLLDVTQIHELGWRHTVDLEEGLRAVAADYRYRRAKRNHA